MATDATNEASVEDARLTGVVDCGVLHSWKSAVEVFEYLPQGWREYVRAHMLEPWRDFLSGAAERPPGLLRSDPMSIDLAYFNPMGDYVPDSVPDDAIAAGSDLGLLSEQHLEPARVELALLTHGLGSLVPAHSIPRLTVEFVRAINEYTADRWLAQDRRLLGTILASTQVPEAAAAEILRAGQNERMAAVLLSVSGLTHPFGHPSYDPIFAAAHELELPIVIQAGGDQTMETASYPAAGGTPGTFTEFRTLASQALMTHAASLIGQGVMYRYPSLRFLLVGGSVGWITPFLWHFDTYYRVFRHDVMFLDRRPSEVFREYFYVGAFPFCFDGPDERVARYLGVDHDLGGVICYASGYPDREYASPEDVASRLPSEWRSKVLYENPLRFLGARGSAASRLVRGGEA